MAEGAGSSLLAATAIVMASNLCFSLRGLYQKLFRKGAAEVRTEAEINGSRQCKQKALDDLNLQFRMQQTGVMLLIIPTVIWNGPGLWKHAIGAAGSLSTPAFLKVLKQYALWSIGNGLAFSSYNLASTYLLTRISVVHHAALNCTRRIFAIVCTGLLFRIPVSLKSAIGIGISFVGFMVFTKAKAIKNRKTAMKQKNIKGKKRDVPIGNGETPTSATSKHERTLSQEGVSVNGGIEEQAPHASANGSANYELGQPPSDSITKNDFGTHRRANRNTATSRFPVPPAPGNNRSVASPFPRSPPPPPPPPPPPAVPRVGF
eukprot:CAMPEP_0197265676 /NCGR_PEP_ID=MMETSP1432-20130617/2540_1 /TAXON_ID=44447 /ORGANISM="Pseudo-nitzschia delicatissima, Strain UNC1205" /LENGTH=317 /DNA_ID=CAMNT_0042730445 /DNA_START=42 /DNA_END=995 /DNA_ORIENTATION=-